METPSSTRRITRSQALNCSAQKEGTLNSMSKSRSRPENVDRAALVDITNDSPIVGLAAGSLKTPLPTSNVENKGWKGGRTPGSGEAILRGQVKTLLQKVEEEAVLVVDRSVPFLDLIGHLRSPASLLAPTPANTPQIQPEPSLSQKLEEAAIPQDASISTKSDLSVSVINRALLFDSPDESETSFPLSAPRSDGSASATEDDRSSIWSLQAHDGSSLKNESDWTDEEHEEDDHDDGDDDDDNHLDIVDLCERIKNMGMNEFAGKHIRFTYDSEGEIDGEELASVSSNVLLLKGLPAPEGKHLRFQEDVEEEP
ncbi:chalcone-flavanone isomerase family protein [Wolffia australiana]